MIKANNLCFAYGSKIVLKNINLELEKGRIYGLLGENGVGKTTLLSLLSGLKKPSAGSIEADGEAPYDRTPSFLTSVYYLTDEVDAMRIKPLAFARAYGKFWEDFSIGRFCKVMEEMEAPMDQRMDKMSCGQLKKCHIAFALATGARYLFMDEPTNGLDIPSKAQFRSAVTKHTSEDSTIIISTHQVRDLENIIDPIIILDREDVLLSASVEEICSKLYFDYSTEKDPSALYCESLPGFTVQVVPNTTGAESKFNVEALFGAAHAHKDIIKAMFTSK